MTPDEARAEAEACVYLHDISGTEQEYVDKLIGHTELRFLAKVRKTEDSKGRASSHPRVRLLALGAHRLLSIKNRLMSGLAVLRQGHIQDLRQIVLEGDVLRIWFDRGFDDAFVISIPWELPMTASLVRSLWTLWHESGGCLLPEDRTPVVKGVPPELIPIIEDRPYLELALYDRLRDYNRRTMKESTAAALSNGSSLAFRDKQPLTKLDGAAIAGVIKASEKYRSVRLGEESKAVAETLLEALADSTSVKVLRFVDANLTSHTIGRLTPQLTALDLSGNPLGDRGAAALASALPPNLCVLALAKCQLKPATDIAGFVSLCARLSRRNHDLKYLDVSQNQLGQTGMTSLAWLLQIATGVQGLDVSDNRSPIASLLSTIHEHPSLEWISISKNMLRDAQRDSALIAKFMTNSKKKRVRLASMRYQSTLGSLVTAHDLWPAVSTAKGIDLFDISGNNLPCDDFFLESSPSVLIADDLPSISPLLSLVRSTTITELSARRCGSSAEQLAGASLPPLQEEPISMPAHSKLVKLTLRDSRLGKQLPRLIRAIPTSSLKVLDVTNCGGGDAALDALCTFLRDRDATLEKLACDGQRPKVTIDGLRNLMDGIRASVSLVDLSPPLQDAQRAAERDKENAAEIAALVKRMRRCVHDTVNDAEWTALCEVDDQLPPDVVPTALADSTMNPATWSVTDSNWLEERIHIADGSKDERSESCDAMSPSPIPLPPSKKTKIPPPPPPRTKDDRTLLPPARAPPEGPADLDWSQATPQRPVVGPINGMLGAIQRRATSLKPVHNVHLLSEGAAGRQSALNSAVDNILGRRQHIQAPETDTEEEDEEDW